MHLLLANNSASGGGAAPAFESIASTTLSSAQTTITFSSIPSTYQHLQLRILAWGGSVMTLRFNNDSGSTQYRTHGLIGQGALVYAQATAAQSSIHCHQQTSLSAGNNYPSGAIIDLHDYANTSKNTTARIFFGKEDNGTSNGSVELTSGLWLSTAALNRIDIINDGGSFFDSGSTFALYGTKGAA